VSRELRILPEAEAELLAAAEWYESRQPGLGVVFVDAVGRAFEGISEVPQTSPVWRRGYPYYRRHVLRWFPYTIIFTATELSIEVTAIAPAVANAYFRLTGKKLHRLPFRRSLA
jgi:plasmid stabilization system protein ParE